jgi:hypothetical protein
MLTAQNETMAKAMVMLTEAWVVEGLPGPNSSTSRAVAATTNPKMNQLLALQSSLDQVDDVVRSAGRLAMVSFLALPSSQ